MANIPSGNPVSALIETHHHYGVLPRLLGSREVHRRVNMVATRYNHAIPADSGAYHTHIQNCYRHGLNGEGLPSIPNAVAFHATVPDGPGEHSHFTHRYWALDGEEYRQYYILDVEVDGSLIIPLRPYLPYAERAPGRTVTVLDSTESVPYWAVGSGGLGVPVRGPEVQALEHGSQYIIGTKGEPRTTVSLKILWPGYERSDAQIRMKNDGATSTDSFTFRRLVNQVRGKVCKFIKDHASTATSNLHWAVGTSRGRITANDLILLGIVVVSQGSIMPILKLRDDFEFGDADSTNVSKTSSAYYPQAPTVVSSSHTHYHPNGSDFPSTDQVNVHQEPFDAQFSEGPPAGSSFTSSSHGHAYESISSGASQLPYMGPLFDANSAYDVNQPSFWPPQSSYNS